MNLALPIQSAILVGPDVIYATAWMQNPESIPGNPATAALKGR